MMTDRNKALHALSARFPGALLFCVCCVLPFMGRPEIRAQEKENPELQKVYRQMEAAGRNFRTFSAKLSQKKYTAVLREFGATETGEFILARARDGSTMIRQDISSPGRIVLTIRAGVATVYQPGIKQARILNLGKNKDKAEFLALGIGQPPAELQKTFDITYRGTEMAGGSLCSVLALKPKDPKTAAYYAAIVMWVKQSGIPIQYKLQEPNNDYLLVTFSGEKLNIKIPDSKFEQKLPKDVEKQSF